MKRIKIWLVWGLFGAASTACGGAMDGARAPGGAGQAGSPSSGSGRGPSGPGAVGGQPTGPAATCGAEGAPRPALRRLTRIEYLRTVKDLLGLTTGLAGDLVPDAQAGPFDSNVASGLEPLALEKLVYAAEDLADQASAKLSSLVPCDVARGDEACARAFITSFGRRAFRRPLEADEVDRLAEVYTAGAGEAGAGEGFASGIRSVLQATLLDPRFLYVPEPGLLPAGPARAHATAAALSYALWRTMPDDALLDAAAAGDLSTPAKVRARAKEMLLDPRGGEAVKEFFTQWMGLRDLESIEKPNEPAFTPELRAAMRAETERFGDHLVREASGTVGALLTAGFSFLEGPLFSIYGLPAGAAGRAELPAQRQGILTHPAFLTVHTDGDKASMIFRGKFIRDRLLCQTPPKLPTDVDIDQQKMNDMATPRELFLERLNHPQCGGCHRQMDLLGIGFDAFDVLGRHRTSYRGAPLDLQGEIVGTSFDGKFDGYGALIERLAAAPEVSECVARQWTRFLIGREEVPGWDCWRERLGVAGTGFTLPDLIVEIAASQLVAGPGQGR
jgi:hypothetical protein